MKDKLFDAFAIGNYIEKFVVDTAVEKFVVETNFVQLLMHWTVNCVYIEEYLHSDLCKTHQWCKIR